MRNIKIPKTGCRRYKQKHNWN